MISRAGKNKYLMNVAMEEDDPFWLDFENGVLKWETNKDDQTSTNEGPEVSLLMDSSNDQPDKAKKRELQSWVEHQVYTQVPDQGQPKILTRWVYTNKESNGKQTFKARLVAKDFQDKDACNLRNDSPTCSKESLRAVSGVMSANSWICKSMDIKTAFLQSKKLDRLIYLLPPKEANVPTGYILKLSKCVYGLTDASRSWHLTLREELVKLGATPSKYDQAFFTWNFKNKLQSIIATLVDGFCFAGSETFEYHVINELRKLFKVKSGEVAKFQYIGLEIKKSDCNIKIGQDEYTNKLRPIPL